MSLNLTFHGAAGCVTGFCARLETDHGVVLVDCGMFQGSKTLKALNYGSFPFDADQVAAVLLTHAHIDHSGLLPKLMNAGFEGPIYATTGARDLCAVMLEDAGSIQESEVRHLNRRNQRRGLREVEPIYTVQDARRCMAQFRKVKLHEPVEIVRGLTATYWDAGHMLGSASVELRVETDEGPVVLLFSGDLGPGGHDYMADPEGPVGVDYLIVESTYGDRERPVMNGEERRVLLAGEINDAHDAGGPVLIPAFAVERSQELLSDLLILMDEHRIPQTDIFLDSPLAIEATEVFQSRGWNRKTGVNPFARLRENERLRFLRDPSDSDQLERLSGWHIVIAASGMCDAGRVRRHLKSLLWRTQATVLLSGYQAVGTLGRYLQEGARRVSIQGDDIQVRARIRSLDVYSGHADANGLVAWATGRGPVRGRTFLAHGEPQALAGLRDRLIASGVAAAQIITPEMDEGFRITGNSIEAQSRRRARIKADAAAKADWHNARAQFLMALNERLEQAGDDKSREQIIARMSAALSTSEA